jgi:teichuronic acid biosynthesis glycosyltransferase TuaG
MKDSNFKNDLVSVIIPCYNAEEYILDTVNTVLNQTYSNIEIIVVDDCSTDNTNIVLNDLIQKGKIKFHRLLENYGGPSKPRNIGISMANGSWIAFLDADDLWHPNKLEIQIKNLIDYDFKFCCTNKFDFINLTDLSKINTVFGFWKISYITILLKDFIPTSSVIIKSDIFKDLKFNESKSLISVEDYDLWMRVIKNGNNCLKLKSYLTYYRISENQISKNKFKRIKLFFLMFKNHFQNYKPLNIILGVFFTFTHYLITLIQKSFK